MIFHGDNRLGRYRLTSICLVFFILNTIVDGSSYQTSSILLRNSDEYKGKNYLPDVKFGYNEYVEYPDNDDVDKGGPRRSQSSQLPNRGVSHIGDNPSTINSSSSRYISSSSINNFYAQNITWDKKWGDKSQVKFGQLSAVSIDPEGNVVVFHRGNRVWGTGTFDADNKFDKSNGPIRENVIVVLSRNSGEKISEWGKDTFYLPHGLNVDSLGNYWITDVAMHQVFKYDAKDLAKVIGNDNDNERRRDKKEEDEDDKLKLSDGHVLEDVNGVKISPSLVLGEAFEPGNDNKRFCKPTSVAVDENNGDFFVSDGYCNSRIIKFNKNGERILSWGRKLGFEDPRMHSQLPPNAFFVPHALALAEEYGYIFVADRERGRISCFHSNNGTFHKEYENVDLIGSRIFSVAYNRDKIYLVNGPQIGLFNSNVHVRGFVIDINSGDVLSQFAPDNDLSNPHDIVVSKNGRYIYVVELDPHKIYRFFNDVNSTLQQQQQQQQYQHRRKGESVAFEEINSSVNLADNQQEILPLSFGDMMNSSVDYSIRKGVTATTIILSLVTAAVVLVALCVAIAAIVARCRKRGCLLNVRRGMPRWESERKENFKLSKLLETRKTKGKKFFDKRPNTRDFSKLNTEPETSDDESNLTKII